MYDSSPVYSSSSVASIEEAECSTAIQKTKIVPTKQSDIPDSPTIEVCSPINQLTPVAVEQSKPDLAISTEERVSLHALSKQQAPVTPSTQTSGRATAHKILSNDTPDSLLVQFPPPAPRVRVLQTSATRGAFPPPLAVSFQDQSSLSQSASIQFSCPDSQFSSPRGPPVLKIKGLQRFPSVVSPSSMAPRVASMATQWQTAGQQLSNRPANLLPPPSIIASE